MKKALIIIAVLLTTSFVISRAGIAKAAPVLPVIAANADFIGKWQGNEQCQGVSAPVAIVVITADGPTQVFITGAYSIQGKIRGVVKGNAIAIPRQTVDDPNFKNFMIEGSLTLAKNHLNLTGVLAVLNNDSRDNCTVNYHR